MAKRELIITIDDKTGEQTVEAVGFEGKACSTEIPKFLAGKPKAETKKPEYYKNQGVGQKVGG